MTVAKLDSERIVDRVCGAFGGDFDLRPRLIGLGYVGSVSHGTHGDVIDDVDLMGIVVPPARNVIGLGRWDHWDYGPDEDGIDVILYSAAKMTSLLLKQNPNVLGFLWLRDEHYLVRTRWLNLMIDYRDRYVSAGAYRSFSGYAYSQLKKLQKGAYKGYMGDKRKALVDEFGFDPKNASHLIRLLRTSIEFLRTGEINVDRTGIDADELRSIKAGEWSLDQVQATAEALFNEASAARDNTDLPDEPDFALAESILMHTHNAFIAEEVRGQWDREWNDLY